MCGFVGFTGKLENKREFIEKMISESENKNINSEKQALKLLNSCLIESEAPVTFYDVF